MKRIINGMFIASILSLGLAGCNREPAGKTTVESSGDETTIGLSLRSTVPLVSRATTNDTNGTAAEAQLHTADVYIYDDSGNYLRHVHLADTDFTQKASVTGADVWETATADKVPVTTGTRNFLVGINLPTDAANSLVGQSMSTANTAVQTIARAAITTLQSGGIPMFSTGNVTATIQAAPTANTVTVPVKRIVAKVTVEADKAISKEGPGTIGALSWVINNQNSKYFLKQGSPDPYADPNWTAGSYSQTDFADAAADTEYVAVSDGAQTDVSKYNALYALENTADQKLQKELTRVTIKATFIPNNISSWNGTTLTRAANPDKTNPKDFYTVVPSVGADTEYFNDLTQANNYATNKGVSGKYPQTYKGGVCYWNTYVNKARRGEVVRNDYYKLNITRIVAPGQSSAALQDPDKPVPTDATVTVDVNILNWNTPVQDNVELVP